MKNIFATVALIIILTGSGCRTQVQESHEDFSFNPEIQVQSSDAYHLYSNVTSTHAIEGNPKLVMFTQTQEWDTPSKTTIEINYPYLPESTDNAFAYNNYVRDLVSEEVTSFLSQLPDSVSEDWSDMPNELSVSGNVLTMTPIFISADFAVSPYFAGAAHPGLYYRTVNFDLSNQTDLGQADMFNNPATDLAAVQGAVVPRLVTFLNDSVDDTSPPFTTDEEWIQIGTAPSSTNYLNLALTSEGLRAQFDPYQVAAYAMGAPYVTVPYSELSAVLKPGLLNHLGLN